MNEILLKTPEDFLRIKETLTRLGIANTEKQELYQTCHILHKQGNYYIMHFKELFALDGNDIEMTKNDFMRCDDITKLLVEWGMCDVVNNFYPSGENRFRIVKFRDKNKWKLIPKYKVGR